jgi:uncharacterized protein YqgV (UPF0045/DUF77 family)
MNRHEASIAIQVLPGTDGENIIRVVDSVISYIKSTGLDAHVGPYETTVDGDFETLMEIIKQAQLICIKEGAESVASYIKIFYNPNAGVWSIDKKISKYQK